MILTDWSIIYSKTQQYLAPEQKYYQLHGKVFGHPNFNDGTYVTTSIVNEIQDNNDYIKAITASGSIYILYKKDMNVDYKLFIDFKGVEKNDN